LQIGLVKEVLVPELQKMSKCDTVSFELENETDARLVRFKQSYPILFECLNAFFGLMSSNSRLCEQQHGSKRGRSYTEVGQDQQDGHQAYISNRSFEMREERRKRKCTSSTQTDGADCLSTKRWQCRSLMK
jgi:hypothetical protein